MSASISIALDPAVLRPPSLPVRILARLCAHTLDQRLADGADPDSSPLLARRAAVLVGRPWRDTLAGHIESVLRLADGSEARRLGAVPVRRDAVIAAADPLRELIDALRGPRPLAPRGIAMAHGLITDGRAPLYARAPRGAVARAARAALRHAEPRVERL